IRREGPRRSVRGADRGARAPDRAPRLRAEGRPRRDGVSQGGSDAENSRLGHDQLQGRHLLPVPDPPREVNPAQLTPSRLLRRWASHRPRSFCNARVSIWRMRSRVTARLTPTCTDTSPSRSFAPLVDAVMTYSGRLIPSLRPSVQVARQAATGEARKVSSENR